MKLIRSFLPFFFVILFLLPGNAASSLSAMDAQKGFSPQVTAHRGASNQAPENTLPALLSAIHSNADFVEIDVRMTADGVPVLCHDASLKRTAGVAGNLQEYTYAELSSYDFGGWFSDSYENVPIPTLEQALGTCKGKIRINIELKDGEDLAEIVLKLIKTHDMEDQVLISSTKLSYLKEIKEKKPEIPTGYIASSPCTELLDNTDIDFFSVSSSWVTADFTEQAHRLGKEVHIWTLDTPEALLSAKRLHADNVITDCPDLAESLFH